MADLAKTVQIIFAGKDNFSGTADNVNRKVALLAGGFESGVSAAAGFTSTLLKLEAALATAAIVMGGAAYNAAIQYESAVADLDKVYSDSEISQEDFLTSLNKIPLATNAAIASAADWIKANKSTSEALKLVAIDADFVIAAELEQAQSTETLKIVTESYGFTADQLREKLDFLNTVSDNSATTVKLLAEAVGGSAQAAELAGLSFEELVAFLTPAVAKTQQGAEVGRAFRTVLSNLIKPTKDQAAILGELGVALEDSNGKTTTAAQRFKELLPALEGADETTRQLAIATIAGADQLARFAAAATGSAQSNEILAGSFKNVVSLEDEANRIRATSVVQLQQLNKAFVDFAVSIGGQYESSVDGVIVALTDLLKTGRDLVKEGNFSEFFDLINKGLNKLEGQIKAVTKNLPAALQGVDFDPFLRSIEGLGGALSDVFDIDLTTTEGLEKAIQTVVNLLTQLTTFSGEVAKDLDPFFAILGDIVNEISNADSSFVEFAASIGAFSLVLDQVLPNLNTALLAIIAFSGPSGAVAGAAGAFAGLTKTVGLLVSAFTGPLGLVAAVGAVAFTLGDIASSSITANDTFISVADSVFEFGDSLLGINRKAESASSAINTLVDVTLKKKSADEQAEKSTKKLTTELASAGTEGLLTADGLDAATESAALLAKEQDVAAKAIAKSTEAIAGSADELSDYEAAIQGLAPVTAEVVELWRQGENELDKLDKAQGQVNVTVENGITVFTQTAKAQKASADTLEDLAKKGEIAKDKYAELVTELQKAEIEAQVKLDIAEVEAGVEKTKAQLKTFEEVTKLQFEFDIEKVKQDTERVKALITGITDAAEIVSGNIKHVIDAIAGLDDADKLAESKFEIFRQQLELENKRLDEQLRNQTRLTDAQVAELQARTQRLKSGDAVIKIDGGSLQPELEAFMFRILSSIQVRANSDAQAFLLGIAG